VNISQPKMRSERFDDDDDDDDDDDNNNNNNLNQHQKHIINFERCRMGSFNHGLFF